MDRTPHWASRCRIHSGDGPTSTSSSAQVTNRAQPGVSIVTGIVGASSAAGASGNRHEVSEDRGEVARDPDDAEVVSPIGLHGDLDDRLAERHDLGQLDPDRGVGRQHQDPRVVVAQLELARRAQHPVRHDAADRSRLNPHAGDRAADHRVGHHVADIEVGRAADQLDLAAPVAVGYPHDAERIGVGMRRGGRARGRCGPRRYPRPGG
jgi:hypothetical protein